MKRLIFPLFVLLVSGVLFGFQQADDPIIDPVDKLRVEKFLKYMMIEETALYTLIGSKPMTFFSVIPLIDEKEKREIYESQTEQFKKKIRFEKFKPTRKSCRKLWEDWKKVQDKYLGPQFLMIEDEERKDGFFINIPAVICVLEKYYEDFSKITEMSFEPKEAVFGIGNASNPLWIEIKKSHYLIGLLLGFGEKNAQYFQWERRVQESKFPLDPIKQIRFPLQRGSSILPVPSGKAADELKIEDLDIPGFAVFQLIDEREERYKREREKMLQIYKDQDFTELTILFLKGLKESNL